MGRGHHPATSSDEGGGYITSHTNDVHEIFDIYPNKVSIHKLWGQTLGINLSQPQFRKMSRSRIHFAIPPPTTQRMRRCWLCLEFQLFSSNSSKQPSQKLKPVIRNSLGVYHNARNNALSFRIFRITPSCTISQKVHSPLSL